MTSLQLFRNHEHEPQVPDEWGTGKGKGETDIWLPKAPSWHQTDVPVKQFYDLTQLKRSNVRDNDQLLPRPEASDMGSILINKSFPAEHPYDSHISRFAVFPTFASPQDPHRGVPSLTKQPLHAETPANSYDVQILHKTKGSGIRHEVLILPPESEKKPLVWNGENHFDQVVKTHGNRQTFYPIPQKSIAPNPQQRPIEHQISERTADTMRNVERSQWLTTKQLDYTGMGPSNTVKLDNLDEKREHFTNTGEIDDKLYPHFANTFDPPRPVEGRISRVNLSQTKPGQADSNKPPSYERMMTEHEKEEKRLWNGTEYVNLPDLSKDPSADTRWREVDQASRTERMISQLQKAAGDKPRIDAPYPPTGPPPEKGDSYLKVSKSGRDERIQEMEAQNRWNVLESQTPRHDLNSLHYKYGHLKDKELPSTFYDHESKYNEERADMYKTSFDPHKLTYSMNKDEITGSVITNTSRSHEDALYLPTKISRDNNILLKRSKTFCGNTQSMSGDIQTPRQVSVPYQELRHQQQAQLQPLPQTARPLVQEKEFVLQETTMGESYNTPKFLQENKTLPYSRNEPLNIMSEENQNLRRVRSRSVPRASKSVQFSDKVTVAQLNSDEPIRVNTINLRGLTDDEKSELARLKKINVNTTQYMSNQAEWKKENESGVEGRLQANQPEFTGYQPSFLASASAIPKINNEKTTEIITRSPSTSRRPRPLVRTLMNEASDELQLSQSGPETTKSLLLRQQPATPGSEYKNEFNGASNGIVPTSLRGSSSFRSSYHSEFPIYHDMTFKSDPRFEWTSASGTPRPQTALLQIQDSFSKSDIKNKFNREFPEKAPEIRDHNIIQGKRHVFNGVHGQLIHG
ncbi:uncharacterized protein LOC126822486 [Patella vulgata]|uniref:uncharacterized protein LOC126822486 n=1 Tax=Patella vulgata TaxID=6465 RepID=UPI00217FB014|nr:uncharacterized protein LOC126822486 [Patella vulgata]